MALKVMHLLATGQYSGAEHVAINIIRLFAEEIESVYVSPQGSIQNILEQNFIPYKGISSLAYLAVLRAIHEVQPDVIHAHDYRASCLAAMMPFRGRIISHIHNNNSWAKEKNMRTLIYANLLWRFYKVAAVSHSVVDEFAFSKRLQGKAVVIPNGIDEKQIVLKSERCLAESRLSCDFLFIGRLSEEKNPKRFLRLIAGAKKVKPDVKAVMLGNGSMKPELMKEIHELDLGGNVHMAGFQENPYPYMKHAGMLIVPSIWEGFGLVALESMLLGCPVLAAPVGGLQSIVGGFSPKWVCETDEEFLEQMLQPRTMDKKAIISYAQKINDVGEIKKRWHTLYFAERDRW